MVAAATAADFAAKDNSTAAAPQRRAWRPDDNDHLIYEWVKMQGKSQESVASLLEISQSTVSRTIQRYERWQAHAREREGGRLDHAERLRAQRWLTFERNEMLLASCLRIAGEMEGVTDVSKSTIHRGNSLTDERDVVTQHSTIDRSGVAARFLRLAFRINMEQLKLAELDPLPPPAPLTDEEIEEDLREAAGDRWSKESLNPQATNAPVTPDAEQHEAPADASHEPVFTAPAEPATAHDEPLAAEVSPHELHNLHNASAPQIATTPAAPCSYHTSASAEKNSPACITDQEPPPWSDDDMALGPPVLLPAESSGSGESRVGSALHYSNHGG